MKDKKPKREYYLRVGDEEIRVNEPQTWTTTTGGTPDYSITFESSPLTVGYEMQMTEKELKKLKKFAKKQQKEFDKIYESQAQTMKTKKHKVEITKEKIVIKPKPGYEIDFSTIQIAGGIQRYNTIEFKPIKKELPKTWKDYKESNEYPAWLCNWAEIPEKHKALGKLEILRDVYNDGWVADWKKGDEKYVITTSGDEIVCGYFSFDSKVLVFKTIELRDKFLSNFSELIIEAKPLL